jgi:hypothetical protein
MSGDFTSGDVISGDRTSGISSTLTWFTCASSSICLALAVACCLFLLQLHVYLGRARPIAVHGRGVDGAGVRALGRAQVVGRVARGSRSGHECVEARGGCADTLTYLRRRGQSSPASWASRYKG